MSEHDQADRLNAALEDFEQSILRKQAKAATFAGGPKHFFSERDTFDRIPGGLLARRNNHTKPVIAPGDDVDYYGLPAVPNPSPVTP